MNDYQFKELLFLSWFDRRIVKYKQFRDGKSCDSEVILKHKGFVRTFNSCYKRFMRHYNTRNECFMDCVMLCWEGMNSFNLPNGATWEAIANGRHPEGYGKLMTYLKQYVAHEMERMHYKKIITSRTIDVGEGKKKRFLVHYSIEPESLNKMTSWKNEHEKVELINCFEESFWTKHEEYKMSLFMQWAIENMENILNDKQKALLKKLLDCNYSRLEKNECEIEGEDKGQIPQKLKRIYNKIAKEYQKVEKFLTGGFVIQSLNAEIKTYTKIMNIINASDIELNEMNAKVSAQILKSMNNTHFARLVYDKLNPRYLKILIRIYNYSAVADDEKFQFFVEPVLPSKVIYKIVELIEERIAFLELRIDEETQILEKQAERENIPVQVFQFPKDTKTKSVHLKMNSYGIATPKYE